MFLNVDNVSAERMFSGRLFQETGPATENARLPSCIGTTKGTTKSQRVDGSERMPFCLINRQQNSVFSSKLTLWQQSGGPRINDRLTSVVVTWQNVWLLHRICCCCSRCWCCDCMHPTPPAGHNTNYIVINQSINLWLFWCGLSYRNHYKVMH